MIQESHDSEAFHHASSRVAQEFASGFEGPVDADVVFGGHEEVARLWGMVARLLGDVVSFRVVRIFPVAGVGLSQDGV